MITVKTENKEVKAKPQPKFIPNGTKVEVVSEKKTYTSYSMMAEFLGLTCYRRCLLPHEGIVYSVIGRSFHEEYSSIVYAIESGRGDQFLIDADGIEVVKPKPKMGNSYPCLGILEKVGLIVLFTSDSCGTVLASDTWRVGAYMKNFAMEEFTPYTGNVTLSNTEEGL